MKKFLLRFLLWALRKDWCVEWLSERNRQLQKDFQYQKGRADKNYLDLQAMEGEKWKAWRKYKKASEHCQAQINSIRKSKEQIALDRAFNEELKKKNLAAENVLRWVKSAQQEGGVDAFVRASDVEKRLTE